MAAIVLIEPGQGVSAALRPCAHALGSMLRETGSVQDGLRLVERGRADVEGLVVGAAVRDPIQAVQQLYSLVPEAPVVVIADTASHGNVSRALQFSPFVSPFVRCTGEDPEGVAAEVDRVVRDHRRRRRHRATLAHLNAQLGAGPEIAVQRGATEYMGRLLEVAPIGVITSDSAGVITACNAKAAELLETSEREALGTSLGRWFDGLGEESWHRLLGASGTSPAERTVLRRRRQGADQHLQLTVTSLLSGSPGALVILHDVTARHEAEAERDRVLTRERAARLEAEEANRAKDEFLSVVSHELRTPLSSIIGWVHMLRTLDLPPEKQKRAIEVIGRNAKTQAQLIDDLLDVSRIISGKLRVNVEQVDPAQAVALAVEVIRPAAAAKEIALEQEFDPAAGLVMADPSRLQQIAWNLLANAVKFTQRGGRVQVAVRRREAHVELLVKDNGPGIAEEFLPYVFERFRQEDGGVTRAQGGLGLGLAIVRHLVELQGGTVSAASEPGSGATFTVSLPLSSSPRA